MQFDAHHATSRLIYGRLYCNALRIRDHGDVAELADALDLGSSSLKECRFKSCHPHSGGHAARLSHRNTAGQASSGTPAIYRTTRTDLITTGGSGVCMRSPPRFAVDELEIFSATSRPSITSPKTQ